MHSASLVVDHEGVPTWVWIVIVAAVGIGVLAAVILRGRGEGLIPLAPPEPRADDPESPLHDRDRTNAGINGTGGGAGKQGSPPESSP